MRRVAALLFCTAAIPAAVDGKDKETKNNFEESEVDNERDHRQLQASCEEDDTFFVIMECLIPERFAELNIVS